MLGTVLDGIKEDPQGGALGDEMAPHIHVLLCHSVSAWYNRVQPQSFLQSK